MASRPTNRFRNAPPDPRYFGSFLDSCVFDPVEAEAQSAQRILQIRDAGDINVILAHSVQRELDHPNTPEAVKREGRAMIFTLEVDLAPDELVQRHRLRALLVGNGGEKYQADADHLFEAGKYAARYFITVDRRILARAGDVAAINDVRVLLPSEWLAIYDQTAGTAT